MAGEKIGGGVSGEEKILKNIHPAEQAAKQKREKLGEDVRAIIRGEQMRLSARQFRSTDERDTELERAMKSRCNDEQYDLFKDMRAKDLLPWS